MKTNILIMALVIGAVPAMVWGRPTSPANTDTNNTPSYTPAPAPASTPTPVPVTTSTSTTTHITTTTQVEAKGVHMANPLAVTKTELQDKPDYGRAGQSWTQFAFQHQNDNSSSFYDLQQHDATLDLFWVGAEPHH